MIFKVGENLGHIGIGEYVVGVIHDKDIWYYIADVDSTGKKLKEFEKVFFVFRRH